MKTKVARDCELFIGGSNTTWGWRISESIRVIGQGSGYPTRRMASMSMRRVKNALEHFGVLGKI